MSENTQSSADAAASAEPRGEAAPERPSFRPQPWHAAVAAALLAIVAFFGTLSNDLTGKGAELLISNPQVPPTTLTRVEYQPALWTELWSQPYSGDQDESGVTRHAYRPLAATLLALQVVTSGVPQIADTDQDGVPDRHSGIQPYHILSLLLFAGAAAAAAALVIQWTGSFWAGLAAGALFAVHPVNAELVGDLGFRGLLVALLLGLLSLRVHAASLGAGTLAFGGLLIGAATLAHEFAPGFLLAAFVVDALLRPEETGGFGPRLKRRGAYYLAGLASVAAVLALRVAVTGGLFPESNWANGLANLLLTPDSGLGDKVLGSVANYGRMWLHLVVPAGLSLDYSAQVLDPGAMLPFLVGLLALAVPLACGWLLRDKSPWILAGALMANLLFLLPSNLLLPADNFFADRYLALPLIGVVLVVLGVVRLLNRKEVAMPAVAAVLAVPALAIDWGRIDAWEGIETYTETLVDDTSVDGVCRSAQALYAQGVLEATLYQAPEAAEEALRASLELYPQNFLALTQLARLKVHEGMLAQSEVEVTEGATLQADAARVIYQDFGGESKLFGQTVFQIREAFGRTLGDVPEAIRILNDLDSQLVRGDSSWLDLYLADLQALAGNQAAAEALFETAESGSAKNTKHVIYGLSLHREGELDAALAEFEQIPRTDLDNYPKGQLLAAEWEQAEGQLDNAIQRYRGLAQDAQQPPVARVEARFMLANALILKSDEIIEQSLAKGEDPKPREERIRQLWQEAQASAEEGLRQMPQHFKAVVGRSVLANLAMARGDTEGAYEQFSKILQFDPENVNVLRGKYRAARELGRYEDALDAAGKAANLDPEALDLASKALEASLFLRDSASARHWLEECQRRVEGAEAELPDKVRFQQAKLLRLEGNELEAGRLDELLESEAVTAEQRAAAAMERYRMALDILDELLAESLEEPYWLRERAWVHANMGNAKEGLPDLEKALVVVQEAGMTGYPKLRRQLNKDTNDFRTAIREFEEQQ